MKTHTPWYSDETGFFGPGYLKEYEKYLTEERTEAEVDFLEKTIPLNFGDKILDCPCGHGRHSIELAKRGYKITGQDINATFLRKATKSARHLNLSVRWIKGDMREIRFEEKFDATICLFSSFGYLENDEEHQKTLKQIAKALKRGGRFVLDVINRDRFIITYQKHTCKQLADGSIIVIEHNFDHATGRNFEKRIRIWKNGKREEVSHFVRMFTLPELISMLKKVDLITRETYGDFNTSPITFQSKRYILVAEKM